MIRRVASILLACLVATGIGAAQPPSAAACSCVGVPTLADAIRMDPAAAVFFGTIESVGETVATMRVEGRFHGPILAPVVRVSQGGGGDCTFRMERGQRLIVVADALPDGDWFPSMCMPHGILGTPPGDALYAAAVALLGPAQPAAGPPVTTPPGPDSASLLSAALIAALLGAGLFGGVVLVARRRRPPAA